MTMRTYDAAALYRVAWLALVACGPACGPTVRPGGPADQPGRVERRHVRPGTVGGLQIMVGEMCPTAAGGRPAIAPLMMKSVSWTDRAEDLSNAVERGSVPRFAVYDVEGKQAGLFDAIGVADVGLPQSIAAGTYVGAAPCTTDAGSGARTEVPACGVALAGCGLAVAELSRPDDPPPTPKLATGGACLSGDAIAVDIDGDHVAESFPLAGVLDGVRGPTTEWTAAPIAGATCTPTFQLYDLALVRPPEPGKAIDPKSLVVLDLMGVVDLDGDGRMELVIAFRFQLTRTIAVYAASGSAGRLELVAEGQSFPR